MDIESVIKVAHFVSDNSLDQSIIKTLADENDQTLLDRLLFEICCIAKSSDLVRYLLSIGANPTVRYYFQNDLHFDDGGGGDEDYVPKNAIEMVLESYNNRPGSEKLRIIQFFEHMFHNLARHYEGYRVFLKNMSLLGKRNI